MEYLMKRISIAFFFFYFSLLSLSLPLTQRQKKTQELKHEVAVTLKLIQVYVTDKKGNPARDLKKSDFILYDNGKLQDITDFEKHLLYVPEAGPEESKLPPARDMSSVMNRKFFFLIDCENNDLEGIAKSRNAALEFIDTKAQPGDEIALISYSFIRGLIPRESSSSD